MKVSEVRLIRWRDIGDGDIGYTAGNAMFGADVIELLDTVAILRDRLYDAKFGCSTDHHND